MSEQKNFLNPNQTINKHPIFDTYIVITCVNDNQGNCPAECVRNDCQTLCSDASFQFIEDLFPSEVPEPNTT